MDVWGASRGWLLAATTLSAALVLSAPFIGQLRTAIRSAVGAGFSDAMGALVGGTVGLAALIAVARIRERKGLRYAALLAAPTIGIGYAVAGRTGNPEVDAVERFHFLEYGLITALFYRAWRRSADGSVLIMPVLAGLLVGTLEEWLQWFIPARIGEARDVLLNLFAISCGLLFSLSLDPPPRVSLSLLPAGKRHVAILSAVVLLVFGAFFHSVHLGYEIEDADAGVFRSRYTADDLARIGQQRAALWRTHPPLTWARLSREDQYLSEGVAHVQRRNETWHEGNVLASRHENLILEKYYAPVLDAPSYLSPQGLRWPAAQRDDAEARASPGFMIYVSDALDYPVLIWPKWAFWVVIVGVALVTLQSARLAA
jgi:VanZ family protein